MKVIDNFLEDESLLRKMQSVILGKEFTWIYTDEVSSPWDKSGFLFCHPMFFIEKGQESKFYDLMFPLIGRLKFNNILRIKVNAYTKTHENVKHGFHRDFPYDHKVALFSLNTNNGGTEFKNGEFYNSVENRLLMFDGAEEHRSVTQTDTNLRVNININYQ